MITYPCANCQRELEIDDAQAGQRVRCPHCGNVEVAPSAARPAPSTPPRAPAPPATDLSAERELARVHPVMLRARPVQASLLCLAVIGGIALAVAARTAPAFTNWKWSAYAGVAVAAASLVWLARWKLLTRATTLIITDRRTTLQRGLLSRTTSEMRHERVQDIQIIQTFPQRLLRVGTLGLDGSGTDQVELSITDLPDPMRLRELIDTHRAKA